MIAQIQAASNETGRSSSPASPPIASIVHSARAATNARLVVLRQYDESHQAVYPVAWSGIEGMELTEGMLDHATQGMIGASAGPGFSRVLPVSTEEGIVGSLTFHLDRDPTESESRAFEAFASQIALWLQTEALISGLQRKVSELRKSQSEMIAVNERFRKTIAELLHGSIQTRLLVAAHRLRAGIQLLDSRRSRGVAMLEDVALELDQTREQEVRQASHLLHPSIISIGLVPAIRTLTKRFEGIFEVTLKVDEAVQSLDSPIENLLPDELRLGVYRAIEEAFNNTYRHARARHVTVSLESSAGCLRVSVLDDGRGFAIPEHQRGLGLKSIAARLDQLEGTWQITSAPGKGTRLDFCCPLPSGL